MADHVVAPDMARIDNTFTFPATSSSTPAAPKAKKFKPLPPSGHSATAPNARIVAPHMSHVFIFSATSSSTSAAPKARRKKKFKPSPPSRRSPKIGLQNFDEKFTNLMKQSTRTPSSGTFFQDEWLSASANEGFLKVNDNISTLEATPTFSLSASAFVPPVKAKATDDDEIISRRCIFEDFDMCQSPESVVPPHIKEFCDFALEKYNNENGTGYRYLFPIYAGEDVKAHDTSHFFIFTASVSDYYHFEPFKAKIKSFGFSEGSSSYVKELQEVSR